MNPTYPRAFGFVVQFVVTIGAVVVMVYGGRWAVTAIQNKWISLGAIFAVFAVALILTEVGYRAAKRISGPTNAECGPA